MGKIRKTHTDFFSPPSDCFWSPLSSLKYVFQSIMRPDEEYSNYDEEPQALHLLHMTGITSTNHVVTVMQEGTLAK